tara:strand:+ start:23 stop:244 length:222 start_codon:yes stop_codon:yes gene_type:complete
MYYITRADNKGIYEIGVQALKNFKPEEGVEYLVRKNRKRNSFGLLYTFDDVPVYVGVNGKLKKTKRTETVYEV